MRFQVHGVRQTIISVEVDAEDEEEALEAAERASKYEIDEWDTDTLWTAVLPQE